jgi:hypothetical protein
MHDLGLTPRAYSSGARRRQGTITTAGHTCARRALSEGAWTYRDPAQVSRPLHWRLERGPKIVQDLRWKAQGRGCQRWRDFTAQGKQANQGVVAIARAMAACIWAMAREGPMVRYMPRALRVHRHALGGPRRLSDEQQPRCGAILARVRRRRYTRVPRPRPAPDGRQSGGTQPPDISMINRRDDWLLLV